jgi:type III restriction enzyme
MATGTGKTVVMAALILYHCFNRLEYRGDTRFADNFLVVAPGVTIRDRLGVLRVQGHGPAAQEDYYHARYLVPPKAEWRQQLQRLNARLRIVNYHAFEPKMLQGNKRSPLDGKVDARGRKREAREDYALVTRRVLGGFKPGSRLLVLNDEAHHCYLPNPDKRKAEGEDTEEENRRASVWFNGIKQISLRFKVRAVYDLSATPYYLTGSGYEPYSLFGWVVSDFGLIEAIESGLVKIPFLPTSDDTQEIDLPVLRNLYNHVRDELPRAGQRKQRKRAKDKGESLAEAPPRVPDTVKVALDQFYKHYEEEFHGRAHTMGKARRAQLEIDDTPPVFIAVCNNTSVSKELFKFIAGYEIESANGGPPTIIPGHFDLFSNFDPASGQPRAKPPTLLIDSDALENSGQIDAGFKKVFASEIESFKRDYARLHGQGSAENLTEAEILREVVNTVGKPNTLGAHVRCVVSVSMLTEGWDANTVTHIMGLRAFGSQLLCEQVAGRALRRKSYYLQGYDKDGLPTDDKRRIVDRRFPPEYAHIIGVPFRMFKGGSTTTVEPPAYNLVRPLRERASLEIAFPQVEGYRLQYPEGPLRHDFAKIEDYVIDGTALPTRTLHTTALGPEERELTVEKVLERREQEIFYHIAKDLLRDHFSDETGSPEFAKFHELKAIVAHWYAQKVRVTGRGDEWKKLLYFQDPKRVVAHIARALLPGGPADERIRPILNHYNPTGSTRFVNGNTTKDVFPTRHSHINVVVLDSEWEGRAAKTLDDMAAAGEIECWVKNAFLGFRIPYVDKSGRKRAYLTDFIVRATDPGGEAVHLMIEVTGMERDKPEKKWFVEHRWLPAVNAIRHRHGWPRWAFLELTSLDQVKEIRPHILDHLAALPCKTLPSQEAAS